MKRLVVVGIRKEFSYYSRRYMRRAINNWKQMCSALGLIEQNILRIYVHYST